ncbi:MAG: anti-sigma factor [Sphingomicrobium sp.]
MTDHPISEAHDQLAAELALGVLNGAELREARSLARTEPAFRQALARWSGRLAPMLDDVPPVDPPHGLWRSIAGRLGDEAPASNVIVLKQRVNLWRTATAAATAMAAALALVLVTRVPPQPPVASPSPAPMVAMLGDSSGAKLVANWSPEARTLVIAASADMPADRGHAHELWVIPADGKPRSLGTMPSGKHMMMRVPEPLSAAFRNGATLAVSLEPAGGSPTGSPTGPVLVSGALESA